MVRICRLLPYAAASRLSPPTLRRPFSNLVAPYPIYFQGSKTGKVEEEKGGGVERDERALDHNYLRTPHSHSFLQTFYLDLNQKSDLQIGNKLAVIEKESSRPSNETSKRYFSNISEMRKTGCKVVLGLLSMQSMRYSSKAGAGVSDTHQDFQPSNNHDAFTTSPTSIVDDPETHEDFQPIVKSSGISDLDIVEQDVKENPVMIYMKGLPNAPRCGFSALAVKVLQQYRVPIGARDILGDLKLKEAVKAYTNWPTFPQIFIKGEFVGGSDIVLSMHQKGELKDLVADITERSNPSD